VEQQIEELRAQAEELLQRETGFFERELARRNAADHKWLQQVKRAGTTSDKVAAATLLMQVGRRGAVRSAPARARAPGRAVACCCQDRAISSGNCTA
jgi:hypothetical protein